MRTFTSLFIITEVRCYFTYTHTKNEIKKWNSLSRQKTDTFCLENSLLPGRGGLTAISKRKNLPSNLVGLYQSSFVIINRYLPSFNCWVQWIGTRCENRAESLPLKSFYFNHIVLNKTFTRLGSKKAPLVTWMHRYRTNYLGEEKGRKKEGERLGVGEKSKKSLLGKACHKGAKPTWNSYPQTLLTSDSHPHLKGKKSEKEGGEGDHSKKE